MDLGDPVRQVEVDPGVTIVPEREPAPEREREAPPVRDPDPVPA